MESNYIASAQDTGCPNPKSEMLLMPLALLFIVTVSNRHISCLPTPHNPGQGMYGYGLQCMYVRTPPTCEGTVPNPKSEIRNAALTPNKQQIVPSSAK